MFNSLEVGKVFMVSLVNDWKLCTLEQVSLLLNSRFDSQELMVTKVFISFNGGEFFFFGGEGTVCC